MSQRIFAQDQDTVRKQYTNVGENWKLYDTVLIGLKADQLDFSTGYFTSYAAVGAANTIPFFNVRNRSSGLAYNNQDVRDQLPYVFKIYSIGVTFWAPATSTYFNVSPIIAPQNMANNLFEIEVPKHMSVTLKTQQDQRIKLNPLMTPPGYGVVSGGIAQGDVETQYTYPNIMHSSFSQGVASLTNAWGFPKPLEIPRLANLSVVLELSEYARNLLLAMPGPRYQPMRAVAGDGTFMEAEGSAGIQVTLGGQRFVQQRGQYHA